MFLRPSRRIIGTFHRQVVVSPVLFLLRSSFSNLFLLLLMASVDDLITNLLLAVERHDRC